MFQSFFYWNCLGGVVVMLFCFYFSCVSILLLLELPWWPCVQSGQQLQRLCFNPSFTGIALVAHHGSKFQVQLNWVSILLLLELPWWPTKPDLILFEVFGFNPSFTGIALVARTNQARQQHGRMFQSFFYWNCLGGLTQSFRWP